MFYDEVGLNHRVLDTFFMSEVLPDVPGRRSVLTMTLAQGSVVTLRYGSRALPWGKTWPISI